jgi:hypothetical protein
VCLSQVRRMPPIPWSRHISSKIPRPSFWGDSCSFDHPRSRCLRVWGRRGGIRYPSHSGGTRRSSRRAWDRRSARARRSPRHLRIHTIRRAGQREKSEESVCCREKGANIFDCLPLALPRRCAYRVGTSRQSFLFLARHLRIKNAGVARRYRTSVLASFKWTQRMQPLRGERGRAHSLFHASVPSVFFLVQKLWATAASHNLSPETLSHFRRRGPLGGCYDYCSHEVHAGFHQ